MTDALPGFTFDQKTGELSRGGLRIALKFRHAQMFAAMIGAECQYVAARTLCDLIDGSKEQVTNEVTDLRRRIERFGMSIGSKRGSGYRLVVSRMPTWALWCAESHRPSTRWKTLQHMAITQW